MWLVLRSTTDHVNVGFGTQCGSFSVCLNHPWHATMGNMSSIVARIMLGIFWRHGFNKIKIWMDIFVNSKETRPRHFLWRSFMNLYTNLLFLFSYAFMFVKPTGVYIFFLSHRISDNNKLYFCVRYTLKINFIN